MIVNDIKDCEIQNDLRTEGVCSRLAPEIYIKNEENSRFYALHPLEWKCQHQVVLEEWPSPEFWREILTAYGIRDEFSFCVYVNRVSGLGVFQNQPLRLQNLLQSFGYSVARFVDIGYTATLEGYQKRLFVEKKIPLKILRLLDVDARVDSAGTLNEKFAQFLVLKEINGNIAKELINGWIDLTENSKQEVIRKFEDSLATSGGKDLKFHIQDKFLGILHEVRYPEVNSFRDQLNRLRRHLPKNIHVDFDPEFEKNQVRVYSDVETREELANFIASIQENKNIIILEQLINLLNQA